MLNFERVVKATESDVAVYVFVDEEKGHTVYLSHNGSMTVTEENKKSKSKDRVAGFLISDEHSNCGGC